jgi:hypothetical protein
MEMIKEYVVMLHDADAPDEKRGVSDAMYIAEILDMIDTMESIIGSHEKGLMYSPHVESDPLADLNIQALNLYLDCVTGKVGVVPVPTKSSPPTDPAAVLNLQPPQQ